MKKTIKSIIAIIMFLILTLSMVACNNQPTYEDAREILKNSLMFTEDDNGMSTWLMLKNETGREENILYVEDLAETFGTPSHSELIDMCNSAKKAGTSKEEIFIKGDVKIVISTIPTVNSSAMISIKVTEQ